MKEILGIMLIAAVFGGGISFVKDLLTLDEKDRKQCADTCAPLEIKEQTLWSCTCQPPPPPKPVEVKPPVKSPETVPDPAELPTEDPKSDPELLWDDSELN